MTDDDLAYSSIADLAPRVAAGDVSPVELTRVCLDRITHLEPQVNAFITVLADSAIDAARQAEKEIRQGHYRGPLHGIPIAHKDLIYTRGIRTTAGSRVLRDFVPDVDATVVTKLKAAGTVLLGKLNLHEFAAGGTSENPHYGPVHNPWRLNHHPGGSSGGSSAALAAGMCFAATGSDTAGSIRIPSHCCGTTGIKPTYGRVSAFGVVPLSWSLDHVGPMTRTARDAALVLNAIAGFDRQDSATVERLTEDFTVGLEQDIRGLRIGIPSTYFSEALQPDVERAWRSGIDSLLGLGAVPVDVQFTQIAESIAIGPRILRAEMAVYHREWFQKQPDDYSQALHDRFASVQGLSADDFIQAQRTRERVRAELWRAFDQFDVLVTPTMPMTASPIGVDTVQLSGQQRSTLIESTRFTYPFNVSGFPALSIPCGFDALGLPIGLQLATPPWQEALLLRVGNAFQQATDWHLRRPALRASYAPA